MDKRGGGRREYHDFLTEILTHSTEKLRRATLRFRKILISKNFMVKRGGGWREGGSFTIFRRKFFICVDKFRRGTLLCFRKVRASKNFMVKRKGVSGFSGENFLFHSAEKYRGEPFCVSKNFGHRKISWIRGVYHNFLSKFSCLTKPKTFVGELFLCFRKNSGIETFHA